MEGDAGSARNPDKKLSHDRRRARQRARRRLKRMAKREAKRETKREANREEVLDLKRNDGKGKVDPTPHIAVLNMITKGKYLQVGKGFIVRGKIKEIKEIAI